MPTLALVAVQDATIYYDKLYSYRLPQSLQASVAAGSMVLVPFGAGKGRPRIGAVIGLAEDDGSIKRLKTILDAAQEEAGLTQELLAIVKYLKETTFCTWFDAIKTVIPYGAQYKTVKTEDGWKLQKKIVRHTDTFYTLANKADDAGGVAPLKQTAKQKTVLAFLADGEQSREDILQHCGVTKAVLDTLEKKQLILPAERDKTVALFGRVEYNPQEIFLSGEQAEAYKQILSKDKAEIGKPVLLHGVTGSGKTQIFIKLIYDALAKGQTALVLVPEIGLTPQMVGQMQQNFGDSVAIQHSALSNTERLLQWRQIQRGEAKVVVGTRSAVFAPLQNIGIIIVDEEQERTYQSESSPRYNAIEVARRRATLHNALLVLASATPAVSDFYFAQSGRYRLVKLDVRYGGMPLPNVEIVDMRRDISGGTRAIGTRLADEINANLVNKQQTILLLNRRGYNTVGVCRDCSTAIQCEDCSVPMVYHKKDDRLLCHYCGKSISPVYTSCPLCSGEIRYAGFGTQRMEEELAELFPTASILRMDLDTTSRKNSHATLLKRFGEGEFDIMLGTQMVAKGLDFEHVSLVGIVGIDSLLYSQGYRASENVFSLVTQVVGRSGRANVVGRALIQTSDPENTVLALAAKQDYEAFYALDIAIRKMALYPPFCNICVVGFAGEDEMVVVKTSRDFSAILQQLAKNIPDMPLRVLGPAPMNIAQVAGNYRYRLTLKCRADKQFYAFLQQALAEYEKIGLNRKTKLFIDFYADAGE